MKKPLLGALTSIRFFAAIYVVVNHFLATTTNLPVPLGRFTRYGFVGVSIFFVLSGFILTYNYPAINNKVDRKRFWAARFSRIYPLYLASMVLCLPIFLMDFENAKTVFSILVNGGRGFLESVLLHAWTPWTACNVNCPDWSLSAEAFFYLVFPMISLVLGNLSGRKLLIISAITWLLSILVPSMFWLLGTQFGLNGKIDDLVYTTIMYNPLLHLPQFLIGVLTGHLFNRLKMQDLKISNVTKSLVSIAFCGGLFLLFFTDIDYSVLSHGLLAPLFAAIMLLLALDSNVLSRLLSLPPVVMLGDASYGIYILQLPVALWFSAISQNTLREPVNGTYQFVHLPDNLSLSILTELQILRNTIA